MAKNHFERKFLVRTGGLAVTVLVRFNAKTKPFEVSSTGFDPEIPGVRFEPRPNRSPQLLVADDVKAAYAWLKANAQQLFDHNHVADGYSEAV